MKIKYSVVIVLALICCSFIFINLYANSSNNQSNIELKSNEINDTSKPIQQEKNEEMLQKFPEKGIPVLMYHSISTVPNNSLCVPEKQFAEEMQWLSSQNYHCLSIEEFYNALFNNAPLPVNPILLTFDDGYTDNFEAALPILEQHNFKATFFIIINAVGTDGMNWYQIKELIRKGNSIGSHTVRHLDLTILSAKEQENELMISKQELEYNLGININIFCFPSGHYNETTLKLLKKSGYILSFSTNSGRVHLGDNQYALNRLRVPAGMSLADFQKLFN